MVKLKACCMLYWLNMQGVGTLPRIAGGSWLIGLLDLYL